MKHNVSIDRLRGLCVLAVVCMHVCLFLPGLGSLLRGPLGNGYYGVTAFFCVSGFLITTTMLRRYGEVGAVDLRAFYAMRFGRIFPALALLLVVLSLLSQSSLQIFQFQPGETLGEALSSVLTFTYNLHYQRTSGQMVTWAVLWSLSIEEAFYLGYPLLAKLTRHARWLVAILLVVILFAPLYRQKGSMALYGYLGSFDAIALGALVALTARRFAAGVNLPMAWAVMIAGNAILAAAYLRLPIATCYKNGPTVVAIGVALVLFASQCEPFVRTAARRYDLLVSLGRLSYEVYLFHMTIFSLCGSVLEPWLEEHPTRFGLTSLCCVVAVSGAINRLYAEPLNRWIRRRLLSPHHSGALRSGPLLLPAVD